MELSKKLAPEWVKVEHEGETLEFLCAPLKGSQFLNVGQLLSDGRPGDAAMEAIRASVRDWRGFQKDGEPTPFSRAALELLDRFGLMAVQQELFQRIMDRTRMSETERKN